MAAKDAVQKEKESQKEQIYYSDTYKDVRFRQLRFPSIDDSSFF
jgi:hypothetical protein